MAAGGTTGRKPRGRPPKPAEERKRGYLSFRVTDALREELRQRAAREGRSISEEVEFRLMRSIYEDDLFGDNIYLRRTIQNIGRVIYDIERLTGRRAFGPTGDPWAHQQAWEALSRWFAETRPPGDVVPPQTLGDAAAYPARPPEQLIQSIGDLLMTTEFHDLERWARRRPWEDISRASEPASEWQHRYARQKRGDDK